MFFKTFNLLFGLKCKKFDVVNINFYTDKKRKINRYIITTYTILVHVQIKPNHNFNPSSW